MAQIDASIALGVRPMQIENPVNQLAKVLQIQEMQQGQQMNRLKMDEYQRGIEDQNALRSALSAPDADPYKVLTRMGKLKEATDWQKGQADVAKSKAAADKDMSDVKAKQYQFMAGVLANVKDQAGYDQARLAAEAFGMDTAKVPPQFDPQYVSMMQGAFTTQAQRWADQRQREQQAETQRHNKTTEGISYGNLKVAQGNLGLRGQELELSRSQPKGQIIETEQGPMLADPRAGTARPVLGPDGQPLGKKLKDAPPAVQSAVIANGQNLARAERALKLVEGIDIGDPAKGGQKGDTAATGLKGFLPNQILNRVDPKGVDARAAIADLGSLIIHDRSGAAVTAAEFPRLAPFIPTEKDDAATVKKKLQRFVQVYKEENAAFQSAYNKDTGYRPPGGAAPAAGQVLRFDANGNPVN